MFPPVHVCLYAPAVTVRDQPASDVWHPAPVLTVTVWRQPPLPFCHNLPVSFPPHVSLHLLPPAPAFPLPMQTGMPSASHLIAVLTSAHRTFAVRVPASALLWTPVHVLPPHLRISFLSLLYQVLSDLHRCYTSESYVLSVTEYQSTMYLLLPRMLLPVLLTWSEPVKH